ncbi:alpha-ketoglutarate-dependent dioxygenase AlkB family protein [Streptomyces sp. NRRL S-337]|uniref:alpha-ketoglutarate-dependent dioxygenase AlkB family protein n=1 Tax=Streptomyces sp. NRRL S-337 TaxID=1463900 RepID=UPI00099C582D|nr:alpha-ketoglutarate-dependent dioxygenase AlkB [Streptomyces sp. NRRL S-337]
MSTPLPGFESFGTAAAEPTSAGSEQLPGAPAPDEQAPGEQAGSRTTSARREIAPGAVHVPGWLSLAQQQALVVACRNWARGPVPIRHTKLPNGGVMSVQTVCLGWHWQPYAYTRTADDVNGAQVAELPSWLVELGRKAVAAAYRDGDPTAAATYPSHTYTPITYTPDTALINFYDDQAKMGMHQDKDERSDAPVVSLSIGDRCVFRFGNTETRTKPYTDVELASGDLFVFGGPSRFAYHGVPKVRPGTGSPATGLAGGRLNITLRMTGLKG